MSITLHLCEVSLVPEGTTSTSTFLGHWNIEINNGFKSARMELRGPSSTLSSQGLHGLGPEETIAWDLEVYPRKPFEKTQHDKAAGLLTSYGRHLASQIAAGGLVPTQGHLWLQIVTPRRTDKSPEALGPSLQHLHWEILEDVSLWPRRFTLTKVSVVRSLADGSRGISNPPLVSHLSNANPARFHLAGLNTLAVDFDFAKLDILSAADAMPPPPPTDNTFRILLVVCRPNPRDAVEYQLVAKSLVSIVDHISRTRQGERTISLHILRPPTWKAFKDLGDASNRYDLVHFDTKGKIRTKGTPTAVLEFCTPDRDDPVQMKEDWIPAVEVCKVLVQAQVRTVVLNACDSASFRASVPGTNMAELLLSEGIQSVLAMAYKVNEEAVEIFMGAFYRSLLVDLASVEEATYHARLALLRNRSRRAPLMLRVELADHIVPVLYDSNLSYKKSAAAEPKPKKGNLAAAAGQMAASVMAQAVSVVRWATGTDLPPVLLGRDWDLLSLETYLTAFSKVLLHGQGGVGKTELLRYACRFWKSTGWIKGAAYIDFDQQRPCPHQSMTAIAKSIASQLRFAPGDSSERAVLDKLRAGKYLVVFDSAEVFTTDGSKGHYDSILGKCSKNLASHLAEFIDKVTDHGYMGSMVVVASRLDTTAIARVLSHHKYLLSGLSVLSSVRLIQDLAFKPGKEIPHALKCRKNIDMLRRAAILVEGNPVALRLLVPELRLANYDCEAFFTNLLYGVCTTLSRRSMSGGSRFEQSLSLAYKKEPYSVLEFAPFWNIVPRDLSVYRFFLETRDEPDLMPHAWLLGDFCRQVNESPVAQLMKALLAPVEQRLIQVGILGHAIVGHENGNTACYHIHPVFTLRGRALLSEKNWSRVQFAYVRAVRLWYQPDQSRPAPDWTHVVWHGSGHQHEDHLYNWRAVALEWCVKDSVIRSDDPGMRRLIFDVIYQLGLSPAPRFGRLVIPPLRAHLAQLYKTVDRLRPGQVPTDYDVSAILNYSFELWQLEDDVLNSPPTQRTVIVDRALGMLQRWKAGATTQNPPILPPVGEASYQQLLHAAALNTFDNGDILRAKTLYEAHLAADPATTDDKMLNLIRRWQLKSLEAWAGCVVNIAMYSGDIDRGRLRDKSRELFDLLGLPRKRLKPGQLAESLGELCRQHLREFTAWTVRDQFAFALERERDAVRSFGWLAREILDQPMWKVFEDLDFQTETGTEATGSAVRQSGQAAGELWLEAMINTSLPSLPDRVKGNKGRRSAPASAPASASNIFTKIQAHTADFESVMLLLAGDSVSAEAALQVGLAREALSSTTSSGPERLADIHMSLYMIAVKGAAEPDYRKGLTHLSQWLELQTPGLMTPRSRCCVLIDLMTCYHGLGQINHMARAAIELVQVGERMVPADCLQEDLEATHRWIYKTLFEFEKLRMFLDRNVVFLGSPQVAGLTVTERARMHQIMTEAKERWMKHEKANKVHQEAQKLLDDLRSIVEALRAGR